MATIFTDDRPITPAPRYPGSVSLQDVMDRIQALRNEASRYDTPITNGAVWALDSLKSDLLAERARECEAEGKRKPLRVFKFGLRRP